MSMVLAKKRRAYKVRRRLFNARLRGRKTPVYATPSIRGLSTRRAQFGFPEQVRTKLRYVQIGNLTNVAGTLVKQAFRMNSIFDPDLTGVGHQPMWRDNFAAVYNHYKVVASTFEVTFTQSNADQNDELAVVGLVRDDDGSAASTYIELSEQSSGQHAVLGLNASNSGSITMKTDFKVWRDLKLSSASSEGEAGAAMGSNPAEETDVIVWLSSVNASTITVAYDVTIVYDVLFSEVVTGISS